MPTKSIELCLDFTDTVDWRTSSHASDTLQNYADLVDWGQKKGVIDAQESRKLHAIAKTDRGTVDEVLSRAKTLREAIYRIFSAIAHNRGVGANDIDVLNEYLGRAMAQMEVQVTDAGYRLGWCTEELPDKVLYPVAKSAAELLTSDYLGRVRECANEEEGCGSLFLDYSRSKSRKWCSMDSCGNKIKTRAYYARHSHST
jgi:predicted RNA-binding Zn ribbon-like protein